jgi:hypothetical protein
MIHGVPADWQAKTIRRLLALGYAGFTFGPGDNWWPIDNKQVKMAGPFATTAALDIWLDTQERSK